MATIQVRALHWNVHSWSDPAAGDNASAVAALIAETDPDVVSLVEVNEAWGSPGQLAEVADRTGYSWIFVPTLEFGDDQPQRGSSNGGCSGRPGSTKEPSLRNRGRSCSLSSGTPRRRSGLERCTCQPEKDRPGATRSRDCAGSPSN